MNDACTLSHLSEKTALQPQHQISAHTGCNKGQEKPGAETHFWNTSDWLPAFTIALQEGTYMAGGIFRPERWRKMTPTQNHCCFSRIF